MPEPAKDKARTEGYSLPDSLHQRIREEAVAQDLSRSDIVRRAIRRYFDFLDEQRRANRSA